MTRNVIFIELLWHHGVLESVSRTIPYLDNWDASLMTTEEIQEKMDYSLSQIKKYLVEKPEIKWSSLSFLEKIVTFPKLIVQWNKTAKKVINWIDKENPDVIVFNTLSLPFFFLPFYNYIATNNSKKPKVCVVIHNSHWWDLQYLKNNNFNKGIRRMIPYANLISNRFIRQKIAGVIKLAPYVKLPSPLRNIPSLVFTNRTPGIVRPEKEDDIQFTIPGAIDSDVKDYLSLLKAFKKARQIYPSSLEKSKLILLGSMEDKKIENFIKNQSMSRHVKYYDEFIEEKEYHKVLSCSDYIIIPTFSDSPYGRYKVSGGFRDAESHGIPILVPHTYAPQYNFSSNVLRFSWNNLPQILKRTSEMVLNEEKSYFDLCKSAKRIRESLNPPQLANKLEGFLNTVVE